MTDYTWTLTKPEVEGSEKFIELQEAVAGTLGLEGGTIKFK